MKVKKYQDYICAECGNELMRYEYAAMLSIKELPMPPKIKDVRKICCVDADCLNFGKYVVAEPEIVELEDTE